MKIMQIVERLSKHVILFLPSVKKDRHIIMLVMVSLNIS